VLCSAVGLGFCSAGLQTGSRPSLSFSLCLRYALIQLKRDFYDLSDGGRLAVGANRWF
jgi:hypothetical protein